MRNILLTILLLFTICFNIKAIGNLSQDNKDTEDPIGYTEQDGIQYYLYKDLNTNEYCANVMFLTKSTDALTIPSKIKFEKEKYIVRHIVGLGNLKSEISIVILPKTIKTINGFDNCKKLYGITLPSGLKEIKDFAFANTPLAYVNLPKSLKKIGNDAFTGCRFISLELPEGLKEIGLSAFRNCSLLTSCEIPSTITNIGEGAFRDCKSLKGIKINSEIKEISNHTFAGCTSLEKVDLHGSIKRIGNYAFFECSSLRKFNVSPFSTIENIGDYAFAGCKSLVELPTSPLTKKIGEGAFSSCESLKDFSITVDTIKAKTFELCESLTSILISSKYIGNNAFYDCSSLKNVHLSKNIKYIGYGAFNACSNLESIDITSDIEYGAPLKDIFGINSKVDYSKISKSFKYYAGLVLKDQINEWRKKKEYETTSQWKSRVTEDNQKKKITELIENVRNKYVLEFAPKTLKGTLGTFDADYGAYPINANGINNTFYAQVPLGEAQAFKENWDKVVMQPTYGVVDDQLGILSCTFKLGNKTYQSTRNYSNDNDEDMAIALPPLEINLDEGEKDKSKHKVIQVDNSIDVQIPITNATNANTFAVIIGNENYQRVSKVEFALNDAKIFAKYCQKTLGLPKNNIRSYTDATYGTMLAALKDISDIAKAYNGDLNVIFYYAGHGIPNGKGNAFLLPIDADGTQLEVCLAVNVLYKKLNELKAKKTIVLMDACFSGAQRGEGVLMAARGVAIKAKQDVPQGNSVVFCAANDEETAFPYQEKGHGMFTYFLLKKLQETKGETTLGELVDYVTTNVGKQSVVVNRKKQTPTVVPSLGATGWQSETLK
jgi:hypothetical protein